MDITVAAALDEISELNRRLRKVIEEADPASLDWRPGSDTSSLAVLATHAIGAEEFLIGTALGITVPRDRDAEFRTAEADKATMLGRIDQVNDRVRGWLESADVSALSETRTTRNRQQSGARCVAQALAHVGEHVGHAEITYQLWTQSRK